MINKAENPLNLSSSDSGSGIDLSKQTIRGEQSLVQPLPRVSNEPPIATSNGEKAEQELRRNVFKESVGTSNLPPIVETSASTKRIATFAALALGIGLGAIGGLATIAGGMLACGILTHFTLRALDTFGMYPHALSDSNKTFLALGANAVLATGMYSALVFFGVSLPEPTSLWGAIGYGVVMLASSLGAYCGAALSSGLMKERRVFTTRRSLEKIQQGTFKNRRWLPELNKLVERQNAVDKARRVQSDGATSFVVRMKDRVVNKYIDIFSAHKDPYKWLVAGAKELKKNSFEFSIRKPDHKDSIEMILRIDSHPVKGQDRFIKGIQARYGTEVLFDSQFYAEGDGQAGFNAERNAILSSPEWIEESTLRLNDVTNRSHRQMVHEYRHLVEEGFERIDLAPSIYCGAVFASPSGKIARMRSLAVSDSYTEKFSLDELYTFGRQFESTLLLAQRIPEDKLDKNQRQRILFGVANDGRQYQRILLRAFAGMSGMVHSVIKGSTFILSATEIESPALVVVGPEGDKFFYPLYGKLGKLFADEEKYPSGELTDAESLQVVQKLLFTSLHYLMIEALVLQDKLQTVFERFPEIKKILPSIIPFTTEELNETLDRAREFDPLAREFKEKFNLRVKPRAIPANKIL